MYIINYNYNFCIWGLTLRERQRDMVHVCFKSLDIRSDASVFVRCNKASKRQKEMAHFKWCSGATSPETHIIIVGSFVCARNGHRRYLFCFFFVIVFSFHSIEISWYTTRFSAFFFSLAHPVDDQLCLWRCWMCWCILNCVFMCIRACAHNQQDNATIKRHAHNAYICNTISIKHTKYYVRALQQIGRSFDFASFRWACVRVLVKRGWLWFATAPPSNPI